MYKFCAIERRLVAIANDVNKPWKVRRFAHNMVKKMSSPAV